MKGVTESVEPVGWTPEAVMDLGRRVWFEAMLNAMPEEELFQFRRAEVIRAESHDKGRDEGEATIIQRQLTRRFGPLPSAIGIRSPVQMPTLWSAGQTGCWRQTL